jgi:hypothetical protein
MTMWIDLEPHQTGKHAHDARRGVHAAPAAPYPMTGPIEVTLNEWQVNADLTARGLLKEVAGQQFPIEVLISVADAESKRPN